MSEHQLPGTGAAIPPITSNLITLVITGNEALTEVSVAVRKAGKPISGFYDPQALTANVKLLATEFADLSAAVANNGSVTISYVYRDTDFSVVSFSWQAVSRTSTSTVPQSGFTSSTSNGEEATAARTG